MFILCLLAWSCQQTATSAEDQLTRFESEIEAMEQRAEQGVRPGGVVFLGSSSIRMWPSLQNDFPGLPVANLGFGGATLPEVNHYFQRIVPPYQPEMIVIYCGENDIAEGATPSEVFQSFRKFVELTGRSQRGTRIIYISMKPSPARWELWPKFQEANAMIQTLANQLNNVTYADITSYMLDGDGQPIEQLFLEDGLHMNQLGYTRWASALSPIIGQMF